MPRPRILPNIVLGMLSNQQLMTGKDMLQEFDYEIGEFWKSSHSQLYPELQKMVQEGTIKILPNDDGEDAKIIKYTATKLGQATLDAWLREPINEKNQHLTSLKLYFIKEGQNALIIEILEQDLIIHRQKLIHLNERLKSLFGSEEQKNQRYGHYLILTRAIERETNYIKWSTNVIKKHANYL
ncbi:PadR family transcriptional regulator [Weissella koreensis]|uniref:PadR family transcriptional regulator n=1 Tax=Weissella koreensis TaxID=165096 RepID=UPI000CF31552|nr:PadR family transcriptional regulator [Weissella koreensis]AVH74517.1 PadR family transcriptional regulator [Weissella koreensis]AVH75796.1 PadR family transcriptional regulator [Weissella koreensis]QGN19739.1 PadR family transcriptional regulator [Weissella koreensis]QGN21017.1 PadR family transcriptional regulator [Weissella koreensis]